MPNHLVSTLSNEVYPLDILNEFSENGESLEVSIPGVEKAQIRPGKKLWDRFRDFMPLPIPDEISLGEGNTALMKAAPSLLEFSGIRNLMLKNETQNPTWSFKDRGSLTCVAMAKSKDEKVTATISTGNMGQSISAYGAKANLKVIVFVPPTTSQERVSAMALHGATVFKVKAPDYSLMKKQILDLALGLRLRVVSGNGPIRVEGYKMTAFEMYEQMEGEVPDFIAVPTSACGHIRGIFKGYRELKQAGLISKLPRMIIVQARNNRPIVQAIKEGKNQIIPFKDFHTIAESITTGNPMGGDELIDKAKKFGWLAEDVTEEEILLAQRKLARAGYFVEPASATSLYAVKKLRAAGKIDENASVVLMLTGSGLKDMEVVRYHTGRVVETDTVRLEEDLKRHLAEE
jgi:threonine synthase